MYNSFWENIFYLLYQEQSSFQNSGQQSWQCFTNIQNHVKLKAHLLLSYIIIFINILINFAVNFEPSTLEYFCELPWCPYSHLTDPLWLNHC